MPFGSNSPKFGRTQPPDSAKRRESSPSLFTRKLSSSMHLRKKLVHANENFTNWRQLFGKFRDAFFHLKICFLPETLNNGRCNCSIDFLAQSTFARLVTDHDGHFSDCSVRLIYFPKLDPRS